MIEGLLQPQHLLIILAIALFVFGPKKLPELGKGLGQGIKQFKEGIKQATAEANHTVSSSETEKPNVV